MDNPNIDELKAHFPARKAAQKILELQNEIDQYHPIDLIAAISYATIMFDRERYQETIPKGSQAFTEYLITLCLKQHNPKQDRKNITEDAIIKIIDDLEEIFGIRVIGSALAGRNNRGSALINHYYVRNRENYFHIFELLETLFCQTKISDTLLHMLGFSGNTALRCAVFIGNLLEAKVAEFHKKRLYQGINKSSVGEKPKPPLLADAFFFTSAELADVSSCPLTEVTNFLNVLSIRFGEIPQSFLLPEPTYPFAQRPIVQWNDMFICPIPDLLMSSLRPRIEAELKNRSVEAWETYQHSRGELLVAETKALFKHMLPRSKVYTEMEYFIPQEEANLRYECDLIVIFDRYIFLIEAKAGNFSEAAKRGKSRDLRADLQDLIGDPYDQLLRTRNFIFSNDVAHFMGKDKPSIQIRHAHYKAALLISITLDDLSAYTTRLHELSESGLLVGPYMPWAVSFFSLRAISELLEFPSQLIDYLQRRLRLEHLKKFHAPEELDYFGHYVHKGLHFDGQHEEFNWVGLDTYTDEIDEYFFRLYRDAPGKAQKPVQPMPPQFRQALQDLEDKGDSGYVDISIVLLQMSYKARSKFVELLSQVRAVSAHDYKIHDVRLMREDRQGICIVTGVRADSLEIEQTLTNFCLFKKYENKSGFWIGIMSLIDSPGIVHGFVLLDFTWKFDLAMERLMPRAERPSPFSRSPH